MKNVFGVLFVFIFSVSLFAQPVFKKQISFLDFDVRNPSFLETSVSAFNLSQHPQRNALLFEGYQNPLQPQIFILKYNSENDSFFLPAQITFSKGSCVNPCGIFFPAGNVAEIGQVIWQSNENGNWDILYGELIGDSLRNIRFIAKDSLDEINPKIVNPSDGYFNGITYEKSGSIFLYYELDTIKVTEKIFACSDSIRYENAAAQLYLDNQNKGWLGTIAAEKCYSTGDKRIVYVTRDRYSLDSDEEKYLYDSTTQTSSPRFDSGVHGGVEITFEINELEKRKLKIYVNPWDFGKPERAEDISDSSYETFNFSMLTVPRLTNSLLKKYFGYGQSLFQIKKDGNNFLFPSYFNPQFGSKDSLIELKMNEPKLTTDYVNFNNGYFFVYSIWEDSSNNGTVQLFGTSGVYTIGGIEHENSPEGFTLMQNYPNPFNPTTIISYQLSARSHVNLKVFDVLGREVAVLVNEEKPAGNYDVPFNKQLTTNNQPISSGVLFYQLKIGN